MGIEKGNQILRIIELRAENVKRLKAVTITPKGPVVQVTGKNGSGKTSVLDSIWWALGGKEDIQSVPLRKGADKGSIRLDLGDLVVERKFNASGTTTLTVANKDDGSLHRSPQAMLDSLIGRLSFDPLAFAHARPREQYEQIKQIAAVELDLDSLDAANKADFDKRTDLNRQVKALRAQADGIPIPKEPVQRVDVSAIAAEMQAAADRNAESQRLERARRDAEASVEILRGNARKSADELPALLASLDKDMEAELAAVRDKFAGRKRQAEQAAEKALRELENAGKKLTAIPPTPALLDLGVLRAKIDDASRINRECDSVDQRAEIIKRAADLEKQASSLTKAMTERDMRKSAALQEAKMPVPGLSLADGVVMLDGLPLNQASDAQQLRLSVAVAMAANPKLRVIRIRDGSLLDEDGLKLLAEMAKDREYQIWIERVDSGGQVGVVMVDGEVAADHQEVSA